MVSRMELYGNDRIDDAIYLQPALDALLKYVFAELGVPVVTTERPERKRLISFRLGADRTETIFDRLTEFVVEDRKFGMDCRVRMPCGMAITVQEKFLDSKHRAHNTVTWEYYDDAENEIEGDWFNCRADMVVCGWLRENWKERLDGQKIECWLVMRRVDVVLATDSGEMAWEPPRGNTNSGAGANFRHINRNKIPDRIILLHNWEKG